MMISLIDNEGTPIHFQGEDDGILDQTDMDDRNDDNLAPRARYDIMSYGVDFDVAGIVRRLQNDDITIPDWQRRFVWTIRSASRFIESLLLGLPIPGIFLGTDPVTKQLYVIDGQQRLRSLQGFYEGKFPTHKGKFTLIGVSDRFRRLSYDKLDAIAQRDLDNSIIHATVVRQVTPKHDDTSMYQIFSRLNSGASLVNPQEIRRAVYQGRLMENISELNQYEPWREIVGPMSKRLKDQELILRFMAMWHDDGQYFRPMSEFLNVFVQRNRNPDPSWISKTSKVFEHTISAFNKAKGKDAFRPRQGRVVNAAMFDSMAVGLVRRIESGRMPECRRISRIHDSLIENPDYTRAVTQGTSDLNSVAERLRMATDAFADA